MAGAPGLKRAMKAEKEKMKDLAAKCKAFEIALQKLTVKEVASITASVKGLKLQ